MAKDTDEKVAVLWDRSEDVKKFQEETRYAHDSLMQEIIKLRSEVKSLPDKLNDNYVTRREFKAVKTVFSGIATLLSVIVGIFTYFK